jgi:hypothetical protein
MQQILPGGDQGFRSPVFIAILLLLALILLGLGFVLGLLVF